MKFYKVKNATVGQGVEATALYHKDNGDELICVRSGFESFEEQNPKAKECSSEDADKLIKKAKITLAIPKKKEVRKDEKLSDEDILKEIENKKTPTVNILKSEDEDGQVLTYEEEVKITSAEEFFEAQQAQSQELPPEVIEKPVQEVI